MSIADRLFMPRGGAIALIFHIAYKYKLATSHYNVVISVVARTVNCTQEHGWSHLFHTCSNRLLTLLMLIPLH